MKVGNSYSLPLKKPYYCNNNIKFEKFEIEEVAWWANSLGDGNKLKLSRQKYFRWNDIYFAVVIWCLKIIKNKCNNTTLFKHPLWWHMCLDLFSHKGYLSLRIMISFYSLYNIVLFYPLTTTSSVVTINIFHYFIIFIYEKFRFLIYNFLSNIFSLRYYFGSYFKWNIT